MLFKNFRPTILFDLLAGIPHGCTTLGWMGSLNSRGHLTKSSFVIQNAQNRSTQPIRHTYSKVMVISYMIHYPGEKAEYRSKYHKFTLTVGKWFLYKFDRFKIKKWVVGHFSITVKVHNFGLMIRAFSPQCAVESKFLDVT